MKSLWLQCSNMVFWPDSKCEVKWFYRSRSPRAGCCTEEAALAPPPSARRTTRVTAHYDNKIPDPFYYVIVLFHFHFLTTLRDVFLLYCNRKWEVVIRLAIYFVKTFIKSRLILNKLHLRTKNLFHTLKLWKTFYCLLAFCK